MATTLSCGCFRGGNWKGAGGWHAESRAHGHRDAQPCALCLCSCRGAVTAPYATGGGSPGLCETPEASCVLMFWGVFSFCFWVFFFYMMGVKAKGSEISQNPKEEQSQETKIPAPQSLGSEHASEKSLDIVKGVSAPPETPTFTRAHLSHLLIWTPKPWSSVQDPKLWVLVVFPNLGTNLRTCFVQGKADWIRCCPWRTSFL